MESRTDMKFYGQSIYTGGCSPDPVDKILYEKYFSSIKGTCIECGANDGLYVSSCLFFEERGWKVFNIEASLVNYRKLIINRPLSMNLLYALSDTNGDIVNIHNYELDNGGQNSLVDYPEINAALNLMGTTPVSTITYDALFGNIDIDLLVLDVEGHELNAIKGMNFFRKTPKVMCIEHNRVGIDNILPLLPPSYVVDYHDDLNVIFIKR